MDPEILGSFTERLVETSVRQEELNLNIEESKILTLS